MNNCSREERAELQQLMLDYMARNSIGQRDLALLLNVSSNTITSWLKEDGNGMTKKNANAIRLVCNNAEISECGENNDKQELASMITRYMVKTGFTQNGIAKLLGVTPTAVSCWLRPNSKTGITNKNALAIRMLCSKLESDEIEQKRKMAEELESEIISQFKNRLINAIIDEKDIEPASLKAVLSIIRNLA